jgi:lipopolysaccharide export LptBFGC system permease protein LptF
MSVSALLCARAGAENAQIPTRTKTEIKQNVNQRMVLVRAEFHRRLRLWLFCLAFAVIS